MNNKIPGIVKISEKLYISVFSFITFFFFIISQGIVYSTLFISCAIIHELSHLFFLHIFKAHIIRITVFPFGIDITCDTRCLSYKKELICTLAGSFANLLCALTAYFILLHFPSPQLFFFVLCNLFLGALNLIPISFFDGGKALRLLLYESIEIDKAFYIHRSLDIFSGILFAIFSVVIGLLSEFNISVCAVLIYACISSLIKNFHYCTKTP